MYGDTPTRPSLLLQIREPGNHAAWETFVRIYIPLIHGYCRRHELQDADAADVAQEVMRSVMSAIRRFDYDPSRGSFRGWLLTITRNKLIAFLSARARRPQPASESSLVARLDGQDRTGEAEQWDRDYRQRLFEWASGQVQQEVKPATWRAFSLTAIDELTAEEASAATGLSPGAVYVARCRVTARLRELIGAVADDPGDLLTPVAP